MKNFLYYFVFVLALSLIAFFAWGVYEVVTHLSNLGVRGVALEVWCGKEGCTK